jgi:hypothetical protein
MSRESRYIASRPLLGDQKGRQLSEKVGTQLFGQCRPWQSGWGLRESDVVPPSPKYTLSSAARFDLAETRAVATSFEAKPRRHVIARVRMQRVRSAKLGVGGGEFPRTVDSDKHVSFLQPRRLFQHASRLPFVPVKPREQQHRPRRPGGGKRRTEASVNEWGS